MLEKTLKFLMKVNDIYTFMTFGIGSLIVSLIVFLLDCNDHTLLKWIIIMLLVLIIILLIIIIHTKKESDKLEKFKYKPAASDTHRYSIILIDDDHKIRTKYTSLFSRTYNISIINKIDSALYLYGFDVIIFDVVNTVTFNKDSCLDIIKILKEKKPYKYIIAISTENDKLKECKSLVNTIICKSDAGFEDKLKEEINKAFSTLDNPSEHWKKISEGLYFKKDEEKFLKRDYINTLKNYSHFTC